LFRRLSICAKIIAIVIAVALVSFAFPVTGNAASSYGSHPVARGFHGRFVAFPHRTVVFPNHRIVVIPRHEIFFGYSYPVFFGVPTYYEYYYPYYYAYYHYPYYYYPGAYSSYNGYAYPNWLAQRLMY
jgi:hypothetical protein